MTRATTSEKEFLDLVDKLKYQVLTPSVTTWGACQGSNPLSEIDYAHPRCTNGARGAGLCADCIVHQAPDDIQHDLDKIKEELEIWQRARLDVEELVDKTAQRLRRKDHGNE